MKKLMIFFGIMPFFVMAQNSVTCDVIGSTSIYSGQKNMNFDGSSLIVGDFSGNEMRTLLKFDLSCLPACVKNMGATIKLYCYSGSSCNQANVSACYRLGNSWNPSTVTWNNQPSYASNICAVWSPNCTGNYVNLPATSIVNEWLANWNYGLILIKNLGTGCIEWNQKNSASPPELIVTYDGCRVNIGENEFENLKIHSENGKLIVELSEKYSLKVFDVLGKLIYQKKSFGREEIELSNKGIYFLVLESDEGIFRKKIFVR